MPIMPEGEALRQAVRWVSKMREERKSPLAMLIDQACLRFNLSPKDCEFLNRFFLDPEASQTPKD